MRVHIIGSIEVDNTIVVASLAQAQQLYPSATCIDADQHGGAIGWTWDAQGQTLSAPALPLVDYTTEKIAVLTEFRTLRDQVLGRLNGIHLDNLSDTTMVSAIMACKQSLKDAVSHSSITSLMQDAQATGEQVEDALQVLYKAAAVALYTQAPYAYTAFRSLDQ